MGEHIPIAGDWTPGIGDPSIMGWFTVFAYLVATFLAFQRMAKEYSQEICCWQAWKYLGFVLLFLAINKQLDLQTWFTQTLRQHAHEHGWYEDRHLYQTLFILAIVVLVPLVFASYIESIRARIGDFSISIIGVTLLIIFVLMRASAFHNMDALISWEFYGIKLNWILELGAISIVIFGILHRRKVDRQASEWDTT